MSQQFVFDLKAQVYGSVNVNFMHVMNEKTDIVEP